MRRLLLGFILLLWPVFLQAEVILGNEVIARNNFQQLWGKRVGIITNPSGVNRKGEQTSHLLAAHPKVHLVKLFGPEHGYEGKVPAGDKVKDGKDLRTGLPVYSLYGEYRQPKVEWLRDLDVLIYDLQDIGVRSYTYISTMGLAMAACAEAGVEFMVLDRPNPLGGMKVEGPLVTAPTNFVCRWNIPYIYGMTCGELAQMINQKRWIPKPCRLTVVKMEGWHREMLWSDTGLKWVPTSPFITNFESAVMMAATGILGEIGGLNVGYDKGYLRWLHAEDLDPKKFTAQLNSYKIPGVTFTTATCVRPGKSYPATKVVVTDPRRAPLVALSYYVVESIRKTNGRDVFKNATGQEIDMFDKVSGTTIARHLLQNKKPMVTYVASWRVDEAKFGDQRIKFLLY